MMPAPTSEGRVRARSPFVDPRFLGYVLARGVGLVGDNIWWVAIGWAAAQLGNPGLTGIVLAVSGIPRLGLMLVGGVVTDLRGARPIMLASDALAGCFAVGAGIVALGQGTHIAAWLLIAMGLIFGSIDSFYLPASASFLAALVPKADLPRGAAIRQLTAGIAQAAGRSLGGLLVAAGGFVLASFTNAASFFVCFLIMLAVRPRYPTPAPPRTTLRRALVDGLRYVVGHRAIRGLAFVVLVLNLVTTPLTTVGIALRGADAGWGPRGYGLVAACLGVGAVAGALLGTVLKTPERAGRALIVWVIAGCLPFAALAVSSTLPVACVAAVAWELCVGPSNAILAGLLLATTERSMLGRVQSFVTLLANALTPLGTALFGGLVALTGLTVVGVVCAVCLGVTAVGMVVLPEVRGARLPAGDLED